MHGGGSLFLPRLDIRFSAVHRISFPIPSDAYGQVADFGNLSQLSVAYVPSDFYEPRERQWLPSLFQWKNLLPWNLPGALHDALGRPEVSLHVSYDTGLFVDRADNPIATWFAGLSFEWATGLRFETWNDIANGTDWGPTYGFLISIDVLTFNPFGVLD